MRAIHNTSSTAYRSPFGACPLGESVTLSIDVRDEESPQGEIRTWVDGEGEAVHQHVQVYPAGCGFGLFYRD